MARGKVSIDDSYCKSCELCIEVCPQKIIAINRELVTAKGYHPAYVIDEQRCIACANCAVMCPDCAITVEKF